MKTPATRRTRSRSSPAVWRPSNRTMAVTRSQTSDRDQEERQLALLRKGAEAAERLVDARGGAGAAGASTSGAAGASTSGAAGASTLGAAGAHEPGAKGAHEPGARGTHEPSAEGAYEPGAKGATSGAVGATTGATKGDRRSKYESSRHPESTSLAQNARRDRATDQEQGDKRVKKRSGNPKTTVHKIVHEAMVHMDSPRSPSLHEQGRWRREHGGRLDTQEQRTAKEDAWNRTRVLSPTPGQEGPVEASRNTASKNVNFLDRNQSTPHPAPRAESIVSRASSRAEARRLEAKAEAAEQLAELRKQEIQIERELVEARLRARMAQIESESSDRSSRVARWVDESAELRKKDEEPVPRNEPAEVPVPMDVTPLRPFDVKPIHNLRPISPKQIRYDSDPEPDPVMNEPKTPHSRVTTATTPEDMVGLFERMQAAARPAPKEVFELPAFHGDISEWRCFINTYQESNVRYKFTAYENVARLRAALKGEAKKCVQHILSAATKPDLVIRILNKQYGRTDFLVDKALEDLKKLPHVGSSANELNQFAISIMNIVSTLIDLDGRNYANNPLLVREVTDRLSPHLRSRYCDYARNHRNESKAEIELIADFLLEESDLQLEFTHARAPVTRTEPRGAPATYGKPRASAYGRPQAPPTNRYGGETRRPLPNKVTYATTDEQPPPTPQRRVQTCLYCAAGHRTNECRKLQSLQLAARWDWAKQNRICFKCMDAKHRRDHCRARGCSVPGCPHSHHRLLHQSSDDPQPRSAAATVPPPVPRPERDPAPTEAPTRSRTPHEPSRGTPNLEHQSSYASSTGETNGTILLKVLPVTVSGPKGEAQIYALLDEGSTVSLLEQSIADSIGATGPSEQLTVRGVGSIAHRGRSERIGIHVRSREGGVAYPVSLRTVSHLGLRGQSTDPALLEKYEHLREASGACHEYGIPQLLLGADNWHLLVPEEIRTGPRNAPVAMRSALGWAIFGRMPGHLKTTELAIYHTTCDDELHKEVKQYFAIDSLGVGLKENVRPADERAAQIFEQTVKRVNDRWEVGQLWRDDEPLLPPSYAMAYSRLRNLEARMDKDAEFAAGYQKQIQNLVDKGYAERLNEIPESPVANFLAHFATYNMNKGKWRQVFDAAAKCDGRSLNDYILEGPDLLQSLLGILLRFREGAYAVCADIAEMFLQVGLREEDRPSQMFLWRGPRRDCRPEVYQMKRIVFGIISSPCLAHMVRNHNALYNADEYPKAVYEITRNHYMDDFVSSFQSERDLIETAKQVRDSHAEGGFHLRGWSTNSSNFLKQIPEEHRASEPASLGDKENHLKILGMKWDPTSDTLGYNTSLLRVPEQVKEGRRAPTRREMLSTIMSIYDPLGLIAQYVISAKIIMQQVWGKVTWDEALPADEAEQFAVWLNELKSVAALRIPRCHLSSGAEAIDLHIFTDASEVAYAATAYWRIETSTGIHVSLAAAKARVTPIRTVSVPRAELTAAVTGTRLAQTIIKEQRYKVRKITYWTDSRTVLAWVRDDAHRYAPFVSHRIAEIAENSDRSAWRWVPTKQNPADDATRLRPDRQINIQDRWYTGPAFLQRTEDEWPPVISTAGMEPAERRKVKTALATSHEPESSLPPTERFSSYEKLVRTTAYMLLFIEKCRRRDKGQTLESRHLRAAEHLLMQRSQRHSFPEELRCLAAGKKLSKGSRLYALDPELSTNGLLTMKTRLSRAPVRYTAEKPIILDGREPLVRLFIKRAHAKGAHVNNEAVVNSMRQNHWILNLRPSVRAVAQACALCRLRRESPRTQPLGDLPAERLEAYQRCFAHTAQDYFGPLWVTIGRRREKRWVALYTCLTTRAVHLEVVHSLSTDSAIYALRRFAARRGWPQTMYSDNQTSFRAAALELQAAYKEWLPALQQYGQRERLTWRFIAPAAPSQGGAWERMVKTVKNALAYTLNERAPSEEILTTLLAEVEFVVNSRPLTHVPVNPADDAALTPNNFLLLSAGDQPVMGPCDENDRRRWRHVQALADHFWKRWVREYFPLLAPRQSSGGGGRQIQVGDCVLIADPASPRNVWPRGLVVATYPGPDGHTRTADVRTKLGVLRRATSRLAVLVQATPTDEPATSNEPAPSDGLPT